MNRQQGKRIAVRIGAAVGAVGLSAGLLVAAPVAAQAAAPGHAHANSCGSRGTHNGVQVQYCGIWKSRTPVFASPGSKRVVGYLNHAGSGNWFVYQKQGPRYHLSGTGYTSTWWAFTLSDPSHGQSNWGWVPGTYFSGTSSSWTGLHRVSSSGQGHLPGCLHRAPYCS